MFQAYSTTTTTYAQNSTITLPKIKFSDLRMSYDSNSNLTIKYPGRYLIQFNGVGSSTVADSEFTLQLFNNGVAVAEAYSSITPAAIGDQHTMSFNTILNVPKSCCIVDNSAVITIQATSSTSGTLSMGNLIVTKLR